MAFLDEISKTIADKSREAAQKAKVMTEVLQIKAQIKSEKTKVKELYEAIGNVYFKSHRGNEEDEYKLFFPDIEKALLRIKELEAKLRELEGSQVCASCGAPLRKGDAFCSKCGAAAPKEEEEETEIEPVLMEISEEGDLEESDLEISGFSEEKAADTDTVEVVEEH